MPSAAAGKQIGATALANGYTYLALNTGTITAGTVNAEVTGGSPVYARIAPGVALGSGGAATLTATFNVPSGTTVTGWSAFTALTAGVLLDNGTVPSQNFASQGTYALTVNITET
jgi:hypothetical protein